MATGTSFVRIILYTAAVLAVLGMVWFVVQARSILVLLILGIIFGTAIEPLVFRLRRSGLSRGQSIMVIYLAIFAIIGTAVYLVVPILVRQVTAFDAAVPEIFENLRAQALELDNALIRRTAYQTLWRIQNGYEQIRSGPEIGQDQALGLATSVFGILLSLFSLLIIAYYWMTEKATIKRLVLGLIPFPRRERVHTIWDEIEYKIGGWTRGQLLLMVMIGVSSGVIYYFLDLRFWLALAIWAGLTEAIPFIGPFIGGGTATLIALADSPEKAGLVILATFLLQQLEGAILVPRVMRNAVGMSPLTVVLAVLIGNALAGPIGSLLAIPIGAATQVVVQNLLRLRDDIITTELRTMDITPLSETAVNSPFAEQTDEADQEHHRHYPLVGPDPRPRLQGRREHG
ncbi:MAG TPA: AI-2E family transporter [Thermomicrobiales bacterium]|nr:AI-2E family transporter [Thermomicrobiales bacterium]